MKFSEYIQPGTLFSYQIYTYVAKCGARYQFSYHLINGKYYECDIHSQPSYGSRLTDISTIHRLSSPRDAKYKICVSEGKEPTTLAGIKKISCEWADLTQNYIKTGITIDRQIAMRN